MKPISLVAATTTLGFVGSAAASAEAPKTGRDACAMGATIVVVRGTGEPAQELGEMETLAEKLAGSIPDSQLLSLDYPASEDYFPSAQVGLQNLREGMDDYLAKCPGKANFVLLGYSQGAQVIGDLLCGKYLGPQYNVSSPLDSSYAKHIVAAVTFGDPSHVPGLSWDAGTSTNAGWFPRWNTTFCAPFVNKMRSYCDSGDKYCDSGDKQNLSPSYAERYGNDAFEFVMSRFETKAAHDAEEAHHHQSGGSKHDEEEEETDDAPSNGTYHHSVETDTGASLEAGNRTEAELQRKLYLSLRRKGKGKARKSAARHQGADWWQVVFVFVCALLGTMLVEGRV